MSKMPNEIHVGVTNEQKTTTTKTYAYLSRLYIGPIG